MSRWITFLVPIFGSLTLVGFVSAQNTVNPNQPGSMGQPGSIGRSDARVGPGQTELQINQQLRQIAQDPKTAPDKLFVMQAACGNQFEIEFARRAQQKASSQEVKQVAKQIGEDHQRAQQQLQPLVQQLGIQLPSDLSEEKQQIIEILTSLPADQFEKQYISCMQADHARDILSFRSVSQLSQNDQVRRYAQQTLPTLQQHNDQINQAAKTLGMPVGGSEAVPAAGRIEPSSPGAGNMNRTNDSDRTPANGATGAGGNSRP